MNSAPLPPTAIIFDLGNVLISVNEVRFAQRLAAATGRSAQELGDFFQRSPLNNEYAMGHLTTDEFYQALVRDLAFQGSFEEFADIWNDIFDPIEDTLALAMSLKGKLPRVILSNTNALHLEYLRENFPIIHDFDGHVFSQEVGLLKPDVKIYEYTLRQYGLDASRTVFIDDLAPNIAGARAAGLTAIQCLNPAQVRQELTKLGVPII